MNTAEKCIIICAVSFIILGATLSLGSLRYVEEKTESLKEVPSGTPIVYGTNLTLYYNVGERLSLRFTPGAEYHVLPTELPVNFTVIAPGGNETVFVYWLNSTTTDTGAITLAKGELEILKVEKLILDNSSELDFVGEVTENGNYTLVFTSPYTEVSTPLHYLALLNTIVKREYPYSFLMPLGIGFIIVGTALALWVRGPRKRSLRHRVKKHH